MLDYTIGRYFKILLNDKQEQLGFYSIYIIKILDVAFVKSCSVVYEDEVLL